MRAAPREACFRKLFSTYESALLTVRGDANSRAKKRSAHSLPRRETSRFTCRATRMAKPCMPRDNADLPLASTIRCTWSPCTENCSTRKSARARAALAKACRTVGKTNCVRNDLNRARNTTCTGYAEEWAARAACRTLPLFPTCLRPEPTRRPPQVPRCAGSAGKGKPS